MVETQLNCTKKILKFKLFIILGKILYNYFFSSWEIVFITIWVSTSGCRFIYTAKFPIDLISFEGCISDGLILTDSNFSKIFEISVGFTDP